MNDLEKKLQDLSKSMYDKPEFKAIIDKVNSGELNENEAIAQMMEAVMGNSNLNTELAAFVDDTRTDIETEMKLSNPAIFQAPSGLPKLDPMFESRLYERIQFDEDAPELRVGPLPAGVKPAVPVADAPMNPVALGASLNSASEAMEMEIKQLIETGNGSTDLTKYGFSNLPQPSTYQPGQLPALMNIATPTGSELSLIPVPQQQELAWKSAVTTQGRRSAAQTIQKLVVEKMTDIGFDIQSRNLADSKDSIVVRSVWTFSILGTGAESTQTGFSPIANATASILKDILSYFTVENGMFDISKPLWFEIATVDFIDERQVGWATLVRER